jgi:polysaccharide export outer membrane protein
MKHWVQIMAVLPLVAALSCTGTKLAREDVADTGPEPASFLLGAGDEISVKVWRNDDLQRTVKIDPAGNVQLPLAGEVPASGVTVSQLRQEVAARLSKYIVDPVVDISIVDVKGNKIYILGEVKTPGSVVMTAPMLVWEAIADVGGLTTDANQRHVLLVRSAGDKAHVSSMKLKMKTAVKDGKLDTAQYLKRGDIVYVPPSKIANVERFMTRFGNIISPIVTLERGIIFLPDVEAALKNEDQREVIIAQ